MAALALLAIPLLMGGMGGGGGSSGGIGGMFGGMFGGGGGSGGGSGGGGTGGGGTAMTPLATGLIKAQSPVSNLLSSPAILAGGAVVTLLLLRR